MAEETKPEPIMVVVDVRGSSRDKYLTVVRQELAVKDGQLVLVGEQEHVRVETFEWLGR